MAEHAVVDVAAQDAPEDLFEALFGTGAVDHMALAEAIVMRSVPHLYGEPWNHPNGAAPIAARSGIKVLEAIE
jgi:hypothetical protein